MQSTLEGNHAPLAEDDQVSTDEDKLTEIDVLNNDRDEDGHSLSVFSVSLPTNGTASLDAESNLIYYQPDPDFFGVDTFNYVVDDRHGDQTEATVTVTHPINDPPDAPTILTQEENATIQMDLLGRRVMVLPERTVEAGFGRTLQVTAASLSSGIYVYRLTAHMPGRAVTASGRMTLVR